MMTTMAARRRLDSGEPQSPLIPAQNVSPEHDKKHKTPLKRSLSRELSKYHHRIPCCRKVVEMFHRIPRRLRMFLLVAWLLWKLTITILFLRLVWAGAAKTSHHLSHSHQVVTDDESLSSPPTRILYIVTALTEYNNGKRQTIKGQDRLGEVLIPVLVDSVNSIVSYNNHVDVYLILGYTLRPERRQEILDRLPPGVGLEVWSEATPLGYPDDSEKKSMELNTRALARQHRFVIKDKLQHYDLFMAWEDDIRITGAHVQQFLTMSAELKRLYDKAPEQVDGVPEDMDPLHQRDFTGK